VRRARRRAPRPSAPPRPRQHRLACPSEQKNFATTRGAKRTVVRVNARRLTRKFCAISPRNTSETQASARNPAQLVVRLTSPYGDLLGTSSLEAACDRAHRGSLRRDARRAPNGRRAEPGPSQVEKPGKMTSRAP